MKEWNDKYNPFNSDKVLMWREWLEGCAKKDFLPPVTVCIDPTGKCTLNCIWCHSATYNEQNNSIIPEEHLIEIADFVKEWGVKSVHVFGGGEPLMHPGLNRFLKHMHGIGLQSGLITNGVFLTDELIDTIVRCCRWIGISVDAGTPETYMKVKGTSNNKLFGHVLSNLQKLTEKKIELNSDCSICAKYLLHPDNASDIYQCAKLMKDIGVNDLQIRPAGWENITNKKVKPFHFDGLLQTIDNQIERSLTLESDSFHVYGIRHKFSPNLTKKRNYSRCWASPITLLFGVDGYCYICGDHRGQQEYALCSHYPDVRNLLTYWNSEKHKEILESIDLDKCPRCVIGSYHEIVEKVFVKDQMCRYFP